MGWIILVACLLIAGAIAVWALVRLKKDKKPPINSTAIPMPTPKKGSSSKLSDTAWYVGIWVITFVIGLALIASVLLFIHWVSGGDSARHQSRSQPTMQRASSSSSAAAEPACLWIREVHTCVLTGPASIMTAPGTPAGLRLCWAPGVDDRSTRPSERRWRSIRAILSDGETVDYDPLHPPSGVMGYEFTPAHARQVITLWMTDASETCTQ